MKRHTFIGRLGLSDRFKTSKGKDETITVLDLFIKNKGLDYGMGQAIQELISLGLVPSEMGLDFLILAAHIYAADTLISRKSESQDSWTREINIVAPVSDPERWASAGPLIEKMNNFLTGDKWTFTFRPRPAGFSMLIPLTKSTNKVFEGIALFSGGLDSLIGAIDLLESEKKILFVSHASEGASSKAQYNCFDELEKNYQTSPPDRLRVWMNFSKNQILNVKPENTTRARSFLFFAIGAFAGSSLGKDFTLYAPENGLISLNVPLDPLRLGSLSTRTMHPFYINCWNELLSKMNILGKIHNPYWNKTKGEMITNCFNKKVLRKLIPLTMSCSAASKSRWIKGGHGNEHCGYCLPCIIRRAGIESSLGSGKDPTTYTIQDLSERTLDTNKAEGQQIRSFQYAIERLRTNPKLAKFLIYKPGPLSQLSPKTINALSDVYKRGMMEVASLLKNVRTQA